MTLRCLFVDFDSYFASVEQYDEPSLRGRPVAVVPVAAETTCCLAASYEAKRLGIRTGTGVREARAACPDIVFRLARPARYIQVHHELMDLIEDCIHHEEPDSIDEVPCRLRGRERERGNAEAIAGRIKRLLLDRGYAPAIRCSIGVAPNRFLAKTASDMHKPDGLTVIEQSDLPDALHRLELRDLCGIGPSMEARLRQAGIDSVRRLCAATPRQLRAAWGSIEGERFWADLHGLDQPRRERQTGSIGHSHVLGPELRSAEGARSVAFKLLAKAAMRLRDRGFLAATLHLHVRYVGLEPRLDGLRQFAPIDDTRELLHQLDALLQPMRRRPPREQRRHPPLAVAVTLGGLRPRGAETAALFGDGDRSAALNRVLDQVNRRYGNNKLYFGGMQQALAANAAPMRIPFSTIPDPAREDEAEGNMLWLQEKNRYSRIAEGRHRERRQGLDRAP